MMAWIQVSKYADVANKRYITMPIDIATLQKYDRNLNSFIKEGEDYGPLIGTLTPILIGWKEIDQSAGENLVLDGYFRIAKSLAAGKKTIMAYVPESGTVYTKAIKKSAGIWI